MEEKVAKFSKPRCIMEPSFWAKFAELKIDKFKLDDKVKIPLWGSFSLSNPDSSRSNYLFLDCTSFNENVELTTHNACVACSGFIINTNTFEVYKGMDLTNFIDSMGKDVVDSIKSGVALREPWRLMLFVIISFSDLKKYKFYHWASYPTPFNLPEINIQKIDSVAEFLNAERMESLQKQFLDLDCKNRAFFALYKVEKIIDLVEAVRIVNSGESGDIHFAFYDASSNSVPGWSLRNLMCLLFWHCSKYSFNEEIKVLSVKSQDFSKAIVFTFKTKSYSDQESVRKSIFEGHLVGWVANDNGKMGPNISDLSDSLDPTKLADRAVTLNLKLMKWRLVPELDLESIAKLRCLLLGAGTLGCAVARTLLGWGINNITMVDSSTVSFSNTVRQTLYTYEDAVQRKFKAKAAEEALLKIHPTLNAKGAVLQIPMPGHVVGPSLVDSTKQAVRELEELFVSHDVVFLLLDSREARWLPTVLCAAYDKIAINAALGFDSYMVQRHGTRNDPASISPDLTIQNPTGKDLGCYFCNDVTQPGNSQEDRTLDQQCTVSRPGLSSIASALAVELMVSLTQHPKGIEVSAFMKENQEQERTDGEDSFFGSLGGIPHTIRGSLWNHETRLTITHRFPSCTACSTPVINEYRSRGSSFILDACNQPNYLERLAGLEDLLKRPDLDELCYEIDFSDDEVNED